MSKDDDNRQKHVNECREMVENVKREGPLLIHYLKTKKGHRQGVLVGLKDGNSFSIGWSLCNIKKERFNKYIGLVKALDRSDPTSEHYLSNVPNTVERNLDPFKERCTRYFKIVN